jgi:hypothetical protein
MVIRHTYSIVHLHKYIISVENIISKIGPSNSRLEDAGPVSTGP